MLTCDNCGSKIPDDLWKKDESDGTLSCPVCGTPKNTESTHFDVSLTKEDMDSGIKDAVPVEFNGRKTVVEPSTISGVVESFDSGLKKVFGDTLSVCPDCGKVICICSLKKLFNKENNIGF